MHHPAPHLAVAIALVALACKGELIDPDGPGTQEPPPSQTPALALRIGGSGIDNLTEIVGDPAGNLYVAGTFTGSVDFDPGPALNVFTSLGSSDVFVAKYSAAGGLIWLSRIGGTGTETAAALARDAAGNLAVGGRFDGATDVDPGPAAQFLLTQGGEDGFVVRLSPAGDLLWARRFGGLLADAVTSLAFDAAGNSYVAGSFQGEANTQPAAGPVVVSFGGFDGFLLSFNPSGAVRWAAPLGGTDNDAANTVAVTTTGAVAVSGSFRGTADFAPGAPVTALTSIGGSEAYLASYTSAGGLRWARAFVGTADQEAASGGIAIDQTGSVAVSGTFSGTVDLNPGTGTSSRTSLGATDWFVVDLDDAGGFVWGFAVGGNSADLAPRPAFAGDGNLVLAGSFTGPVDFDPGSGNRILVSLATAGSDAFAARYTPGGGLLWVIRFGESSTAAERTTAASALTFDAAGNLLVAGQFFGSPDFDPGAPAFRLLSLGLADGFVVKLTPGGTLAIAP